MLADSRTACSPHITDKAFQIDVESEEYQRLHPNGRKRTASAMRRQQLDNSESAGVSLGTSSRWHTEHGTTGTLPAGNLFQAVSDDDEDDGSSGERDLLNGGSDMDEVGCCCAVLCVMTTSHRHVGVRAKGQRRRQR